MRAKSIVRLVSLSTSLLLAACGAEPIGTGETKNPEVKAYLLAEVDGCRIWKVYDKDWDRFYFARCPDNQTTAQTQSCGKNCRESIRVETMYADRLD